MQLVTPRAVAMAVRMEIIMLMMVFHVSITPGVTPTLRSLTLTCVGQLRLEPRWDSVTHSKR